MNVRTRLPLVSIGDLGDSTGDDSPKNEHTRDFNVQFAKFFPWTSGYMRKAVEKRFEFLQTLRVLHNFVGAICGRFFFTK